MLMEMGSKTSPFAALNLQSAAKQTVCSLGPGSPHRAAAPPVCANPQHPPSLTQVKAGGTGQVLST